ncbi:ABC transporter permease [Modestobacter sp. NPDC049651]|uniref:ABC transporter permease n=1 Tax=unclassified Modestobacter TaxID=2643866 RepID=UPI0033CC7D91
MSTSVSAADRSGTPDQLPTPDRPTPAARPARRLSGGDLLRRWAVVLLWVAMAAAFAIASPDLFLRQGTFNIIFGANGQLVFLCMAVLAPFCVGEFDFSVAGVMGLTGVTVTVLYGEHGWSLPAAVVTALLVGMVAGALNGFIVVVLGVDPIITTLGMATALQGASLWASGMSTVTGLPVSFGNVVTTKFLGMPLFFWYGVVLTLAFAYVLHVTPLGRHMAFVGANREVARLAGIRVNRLRFGAFTFSGTIAGLAGVLLAANIGGFDPTSSGIQLLPALAATFLGTAILFPGRFNPLGTWIAVFFLSTGIVGLQLLGLTGWISDVFFGGSLVVAVTVSTLLRRRKTRF